MTQEANTPTLTTAYLHSGNHIDGIPGWFPTGSQITYNEDTKQMVSIKPIGENTPPVVAFSDTAHTEEPQQETPVVPAQAQSYGG